MFSIDEFIRLIKGANTLHWSSTKSSMTELVDLLSHYPLGKSQEIQLQKLIWPVGINPQWEAKKRKYKRALAYVVKEQWNLPERVVLKRGEQKTHWQERKLDKAYTFVHKTAQTNLKALDPRMSTEFCYPCNGLFSDWSKNEFVFAIPKHGGSGAQKGKKFGEQAVEFTLPSGTPYMSSIPVDQAHGEIAFSQLIRILTGSSAVAIHV